jgi:hypothetical protein
MGMAPRQTLAQSRRKTMNAVRAGAVVVLGALTWGGCTPDFAENGNSQVTLILTAINDGAPLDSDVRISTGAICPDLVTVRLENHFKNPNVTDTGFRHDLIVERYEVHYLRSDGRGVEGVDVPFSLTGNLAALVPEEGESTFSLEVVRRQAKVEPPLGNLTGGGGAFVVTMFADITLHARTATGEVANPVTGRLQLDFADFADDLTTCPTS